LAKTGRSDLMDLRRLRPDSALIQELKTLTRDQAALIESQTRLVNQLTACLKSYYPVALEFFTKLQQPSTLHFLQTYPTPEAAREASLEQLTQTLKTIGHTRAEAVAGAIRQRLQQPLARLNGFIFTAYITSLAPRDRARVERMMAAGRPLVEVEEFVHDHVSNLPTVYQTALAEFRTLYLREVTQGERT